MKFAHKGLRRFHDRDDARGLNPDHVARIRRILTTLQDVRAPSDMNFPGWRLHCIRSGVNEAGDGVFACPATGGSSSASSTWKR